MSIKIIHEVRNMITINKKTIKLQQQIFWHGDNKGPFNRLKLLNHSENFPNNVSFLDINQGYETKRGSKKMKYLFKGQ